MEALEKLANAVARCKEQRDRRYHLFLTRSLAQYSTRRNYRILASLIRYEYFSTVLTASSDTGLEEELDELGLHYEVLIVGQHASELIVEALDSVEENSIYIVKLPELELSTGQTMLFSDLSRAVQNSLQVYFNRNIAIVGYMDQKEIGLSALAAHKGGGIYYVREDDPPVTDIVVKCIEGQGKQLSDFLITGHYGKFEVFSNGLDVRLRTRLQNRAIQRSPSPPEHRLAVKEPSPMKNPTTHSPSSVDDEDTLLEPRPTILLENPEAKRTTIFISYSHEDDIHLQRLHVHLKPLERDLSVNINTYNSDGLLNVNVWSDKRIKPGDNWRNKIGRAMETARIAILLVSADFLASDFIRNTELPVLLKLHAQEDVIILPVIVGACDYEHTKLADIQAVNKASAPLTRAPSDANEKVWSGVVRAVRENLAKKPA